MRFRLLLEYDGTDYRGWQVQPGERTVQGVLEEALQELLGHPVRIAAAGRTDAGVHAVGQVVSFPTDRAFEAETVLRATNALTPRDLAIRAVDVVPDDFDPRRAASSRRYVYHVWNRRFPSPLWRRFAWSVRQPLDLGAIREAASVMVGEHDFSSFRAAGCDAAHPIRRVLCSEITAEGDLLRYEIQATAFLRHMVRNIVGTLVEVGTGRRSPRDMAVLLAERDRTRAGPTAPAHGLCLTEVCYLSGPR